MGWFGNKIEVEIVGSDGKPKKVKIPERQFKQWEAEGKIRRVNCSTHILDVIVPYHVDTWIIGKDVSQETYDRFKDENGHLYAMGYFRDGNYQMSVVAKPLWEERKREILATPTPSTIEEHFDYYYKALLALDFDAQAVAAVTMNTLWRAFNATYPDLESFRDASESSRAEYLSKLGEAIKQMASDELMGKSTARHGVRQGAALVQVYLGAVGNDDVALVKRIAQALEPFNKMASDMLEATRGAPKPGGG